MFGEENVKYILLHFTKVKTLLEFVLFLSTPQLTARATSNAFTLSVNHGVHYSSAFTVNIITSVMGDACKKNSITGNTIDVWPGNS